MRKILLILFVWTSFYFTLPAVAIAEADKPQMDRPQPEQMMQRIRRAQTELDEQRYQLEMERQELERQRDRMSPQRQWPKQKPMHMGSRKPIYMLLMAICAAVHILVAIWVFQDIRSRGAGSGIWIVIALLAGLLGALVYAVVRLGEMKQSEKQPTASVSATQSTTRPL